MTLRNSGQGEMVESLIVTSNGKNVYPEEVENESLKSPYVAEVVVYAHRSDPMAALQQVT